MATSTESAELKLVSSIRYKLASVSGDEKKLSEVLQSQLTLLLEKAGSRHNAVREETFKAFMSVKNFARPSGVVLPVASLLEQYKRTGSPIVKQLDLALIKEGMPRLGQAQRRDLLPAVLRGISKESNSAGAAGFFNIFLRLLLEIKIPGRGSAEDVALRDTVGLADPADAKYVAKWLGKLFLLRQDIALAAEADLPAKLNALPAGLSIAEISFLRNKDPNTWKPSQLNSLSLPECKIKAVGFLATGAFKDEERYLPIIYAAGSADSRIVSVANDVLKRADVDLESESLVESLFVAHGELPVAQRVWILRLLSRSATACLPKQRVIDAVKQDFDLTAGEAASVVGLEASRLHKALLAFLSWIGRNSSEKGSPDERMGPALVLILKDYVLRQGWPAPSPRANQSQFQEQPLRANAYETIGTLARVSNLDHKAKDSLLKWLFDSLVSDPSPEVVVHIESALSSMMSLFKSTDAGQHRDLEVLLLEYMTSSEHKNIRTARHVAVRFAVNCLPFSNIKARWISMLALAAGSSERRDVLEEGQRGLDPWWAWKLHPDETLRLPDWVEAAKYLFEPVHQQQLEDNEMAIDRKSSYSLYPDDRLGAFAVAIHFVKHMLLLTSMAPKNMEMDWEAKLTTQLHNDSAARRTIRAYIGAADTDAILVLLNAAFDGIRDHPEIGAGHCIACLADVLWFAPSETIISVLAKRTGELLPLFGSNDPVVRQLVSKTFGILAPWDDRTPSHIQQLKGLLSSTNDPPASLSAQCQCSLTSLASYLSRAIYYGRLVPTEAEDDAQYIYSRSTAALVASDTGMRNAAMDSLAQIWTAGIGFPPTEESFTKTIDLITSFATKGDEKAIYALGRLAIPRLSELSQSGELPAATILEKLFSLTDVKSTEVHFATGEAIAAAIARWDSESVQLSIDIQPTGRGDEVISSLRKRPEQLGPTITKLVNDCKATKPSLIKASGIWLFSIIQFCSGLPEIQSRLRDCQVAFMRLLTARDELVQETASRGLSLVYEKGDESLKGDLVRDLVASFTGTKTQLKVDDDTELFDAGALPTGEGKSVTSYKDIINLANEVGDQSLIYKFMALATNAATWTARSAFGRFGLSNILSDAELDPKIYPKLYRYRFDPNENVRRSMDGIWKAVAKDDVATIDVHFDAIMEDLLKSILDGREWRVREASCAAISELVYGKPFPKYERYYADIWRVALRVLDDQKGSVRVAAMKLCMALSKTLLSQLQENNSSSSAQAMIAQVLPFLLSDKGVESSVQEVKFLAIRTVREIVKDGGNAMKPFVSAIAIHFLGLLSTVEPEQVNYYYQRVNEDDREALDKLRSTAATRSPLFECIVNCLRSVDETVMSELAPQLVTTMKSAIGMQTKIGCGEVLGILALRHSAYLAPYTPSFLKSLQTQVLDRNNEVSKGYAKSAAYLLRSASGETRDHYTARLVDLYFAADDEVRRQKVADALLAVAKASPDVFSDLEARLLPFSYFGKHDTDEYVAEVFQEAWNQHAGGNHTVKRYIAEITELISKGLETSKWALQHGAAFTVASMVTALSGAAGQDGQFSESTVQQIWPVLDKSLALKTFPGKEKLVTAYPLFISHSKQLWEADVTAAAYTKKIAVREAKRNNDEYRPHAFEALAQYAAAREDLDMYGEVVALVVDHLPEDTQLHKRTELERKTMEAVLKAIMTAYNRPKMRSSPTTVLREVFDAIGEAKLSLSPVPDVLFTNAIALLEKATESEAVSSTDQSALALSWFRLLLQDGGLCSLESQRAGRAKALHAFTEAWNKGVFAVASAREPATAQEMRSILARYKSEDRSLDVQKLLEQALQRLED